MLLCTFHWRVGWVFHYFLRIYSRQLALPLNLLFKVKRLVKWSKVDLIAFYNLMPQRCKPKSAILLSYQKKHSQDFFFSSDLDHEVVITVHGRKLNSGGESSAQGDLSDISIISVLRGFSCTNRCHCCLQALLSSAAFQWQEWDESKGQGRWALHTGGHNTDRRFGSVSNRERGSWGKVGQEHQFNWNGVVQPFVESWRSNLQLWASQ